jgi:tetratricopeptide (TPR) repeat protein
MMGRYDKALRALKKATQIVDNDPIIFEHLGDAYKASSKQNEALKAWRRSLEVLNPEDLGEPDASDLRKRVQDKIRQTGEAQAD